MPFRRLAGCMGGRRRARVGDYNRGPGYETGLGRTSGVRQRVAALLGECGSGNNSLWLLTTNQLVQEPTAG
jgi:hypothetical protein